MGGLSRSVRLTRVAVVVALIAVAASVMGCDILAKEAAGEDGMSADVSYSVRSTPSGRVKPGGAQQFFVEKFTDDHFLEQGGSEMAPAWKWSVTGPAAGTVVSDGGGRAHWTAPMTEGTYTIKARGGRTLTCTVKVTAKDLRIKHSATGAPIAEEGQEKPQPGTPVKVLDTGNALGVKAGGTAPSFTLSNPATVVSMMDYHYVEGGGPTPGTIGLKDAAGKMYGPWSCTGADGQGGVKNALWNAAPNVKLPAGTYTVVDSDPGTWSTNDRAKGVGFAIVNVVY